MPEKRGWVEETLAEGVEKKHALSLAEWSHGFTTARVGPRFKVYMPSLDGQIGTQVIGTAPGQLPVIYQEFSEFCVFQQSSFSIQPVAFRATTF